MIPELAWSCFASLLCYGFESWLQGSDVLLCLAYILHLGGDLITLALFYMTWLWFVSQITYALTLTIACRPLP